MTELSTIPISRLNNTELDTKIKTEIDKNGIDLSTITTNCITEIPQDVKLELNKTTWHAWEQSRTFTVIYTKSATPQINDKVYINEEEVGYISQVSGTTIYAYATKEAGGGFPMGSELDFARYSSYDYTSSTLILKAGSKVYIPNGFESDGTTPKFDVVMIESDVSTKLTWLTSDQAFVFLVTGIDGTALSIGDMDAAVFSKVMSGTTFPTAISGIVFYKTDENLVYRYSEESSEWLVCRSFPIGIVSAGTSGLTSIDQVFNGFGYIGSIVFALPGAKGLIPNGRNEDGTLNSVSVIIQSVQLKERADTFSPAFLVVINDGTLGIYQTNFYNEEENYNISGTSSIQNVCRVGTLTLTSGKISNFNTKTTFRALDYNDKPTVTYWE